MFARISTQAKLDQMYDCIILDSLDSLAELEPIKSKIKKLELL